MRTFETGATRNTEEGKVDFEGCLSPLVLEEFAKFMLKHETLADGSKRTSDNWQKGIPADVYMKSLLRHVMDVWKKHRTGNYHPQEMKDALCAVLFNTQGLLLELITQEAAVDFSTFEASVVGEYIKTVEPINESNECTCGLFPSGECDGICRKG